MPAKGYSTIGLKPTILAKLQDITDKIYPGMFLPSTLIIMMNEIKKGYYSVESYNIRLDLSGHYNTITIRIDIKQWLEENYERLGEEYAQKYGARCFTKFVSYFIVNALESKINGQDHVISLKESDFEWLQEEYGKYKAKANQDNEIVSFERFADSYINNLLLKIKAAKEILTV